MTNEQELLLMKARVTKLEGSDKNIKSGGVLRKLRRKIHKFENS